MFKAFLICFLVPVISLVLAKGFSRVVKTAHNPQAELREAAKPAERQEQAEILAKLGLQKDGKAFFETHLPALNALKAKPSAMAVPPTVIPEAPAAESEGQTQEASPEEAPAEKAPDQN